jgi:pilus assembly protein CpaE
MVFLTRETSQAAAEMPPEIAGFSVIFRLLDPGIALPSDDLKAAQVILVEFRPEQAHALDRIIQIVAHAKGRPVVAAVTAPSLDQVRTLMRAGITDVIPLPLEATELKQTLASLRDRVDALFANQAASGRVVTFVKSKGGIGGTTVATQVAAAAAAQLAGSGEVCLLDFDVQLGCAALYLGIVPRATLADVLAATERLDGPALRMSMDVHPSGLHVLAAPPDIMPLDAVSVDQALAIVDMAAREFQFVFVDGPLDWTDWSMSVMARSHQLYLLTDLSLAGLHNGRRRLELMQQQGLSDIPLEVVITRAEKRMFRALSFKDAETALGRDVNHSVAEDDAAVSESLTRGRLVSDLHPHSRASRDLEAFCSAILHVQPGEA